MNRTRTLFIIPAALQEKANAICEDISPLAKNTFDVEMEKDGQRFYVASWSIEDEMLMRFQELFGKLSEVESKSVQLADCIKMEDLTKQKETLKTLELKQIDIKPDEDETKPVDPKEDQKEDPTEPPKEEPKEEPKDEEPVGELEEKNRAS